VLTRAASLSALNYSDEIQETSAELCRSFFVCPTVRENRNPVVSFRSFKYIDTEKKQIKDIIPVPYRVRQLEMRRDEEKK
jgi:hypothetical protein